MLLVEFESSILYFVLVHIFVIIMMLQVKVMNIVYMVESFKVSWRSERVYMHVVVLVYLAMQ